MSRKLIWILTVFISLASFGLIIVQSKWLRIAVDVKREQFVQSANLALKSIIDGVDNQENLYQIISENKPFSTISSTGNPRQTYSTSILNQTRSGFRTLQKNREVFIINQLDSLKIPSIISINSKDSIIINKTGKINRSQFNKTEDNSKFSELGLNPN
jgi:hypothetical protein